MFIRHSNIINNKTGKTMRMFMRKINRSLHVMMILPVIAFSVAACSNAGDKQPTAKNIIFLIGDGMGLHQVYAAYTINGGSLEMMRATHVGLQTNFSANRYITDSAASGTALACGKKTKNGMIGMDTARNELESILKVAERNGMATGLVSTSAITHATPASFIANEKSRNNYEAIAADFLNTDIDVFIGGGLDHFSKREDGRDLTRELEEKGYTVLTDLNQVGAHTSGKLAALTAPVHNPNMLEGREDMLPFVTGKALELLNADADGFFVMIEGSQIDWGGHANDEAYMLQETLDFDKAVKVALDFAEQDGETLVVVTADHETGGMMILNGNFEEKKVETMFTTGGHTWIMLPVFAYGPGAELFTGVYDNTDFKAKFMQALGISETEE
jgi:alkaline phosphatase